MTMVNSGKGTNVHVLAPTPQLRAMLTMIRSKDTSRADFIFYSDRIIRLLVEEGSLYTLSRACSIDDIVGLNYLPVKDTQVDTPVGVTTSGAGFVGKICGISIMRAGEAMEQGLRDCCR